MIFWSVVYLQCPGRSWQNSELQLFFSPWQWYLTNPWRLDFLWLPLTLPGTLCEARVSICSITLFPPLLINPTSRVLATSGDTELLNTPQQNFQIFLLRSLISSLLKFFSHYRTLMSPLQPPFNPCLFSQAPSTSMLHSTKQSLLWPTFLIPLLQRKQFSNYRCWWGWVQWEGSCSSVSKQCIEDFTRQSISFGGRGREVR